MSLQSTWQQRSTREKRILLGAALVLAVLSYFLFYIEPLQKKTQQLQQQSSALSAQLPEITSMVKALQGGGDYNTALKQLVALSQTETGTTASVFVSKALPEAKAKALFETLYPHGKTKLTQTDTGIIVWHQNK